MTEPWKQDEPEDAMSYGLILPFVDESPAFCLGFESGQLYERMKREPSAFVQPVHAENQRQLMLAATEAGRRIRFEPLDDAWASMYVEAK